MWVSVVHGLSREIYQDGFRLAVSETEEQAWRDLYEGFLELGYPQDFPLSPSLEALRILTQEAMEEHHPDSAYTVIEVSAATGYSVAPEPSPDDALAAQKEKDLREACEATREWLNGDSSPDSLFGGEKMLAALRKAIGGYVYSPTGPVHKRQP